MNSFQAIREAKLPKTIPGRITIDVEREDGLFKDESAPIKSFKITDNGIGLDDDNFNSFNTAFSRRKVASGGKGLGRITWLKAFEGAEIESVFRDTGRLPYGADPMFSARNLRPRYGRPAREGRARAWSAQMVRLFKLKKQYCDKVPRSVEGRYDPEAHRTLHSDFP